MLFRKLISFGKNSYVISLPKEWIINNKLKKGSMLSVDVHSSQITIFPQNVKEEVEKTSITINIEGKKFNQIRIEIINAYLLNYDIIEIVYKDNTEDIDRIKDVIMSLAGLEIIEQTKSRILIKYLIDPSEISLMALVRRMDNVTRSLLTDMIESLQKGSFEGPKHVSDDDVNRINFLIMRTSRSSLSSSKHMQGIDGGSWKLYTILNIAEQIELISDAQKIMCNDFKELTLSPQITKSMIDLVTEIKTSFGDVMKAYYQSDRNLALKVELGHKEQLAACKNLTKTYIQTVLKKKGADIDENVIFGEVIDEIRSIVEAINRICRIIIDS